MPGGGEVDIASANYATAPGGVHDTASGQYATVGGGLQNTASDYYATVGGGYNNLALSIRLTTTNTAMVHWLSPATGWHLEVNTDLSTTHWVAPPETVQDDGTHKFIIVAPAAGSRFHRLHKS